MLMYGHSGGYLDIPVSDLLRYSQKIAIMRYRLYLGHPFYLASQIVYFSAFIE